MSFEVQRSVEIARPPEEVFALVADARNDPRWCPKVLSTEQVGGTQPGVGARYTSIHRPTRLKPAAEISSEIVAFDSPHSMTWRGEDEDGVFNVTYRLQPTRDGTRFTQVSDVEWKIARPLQLVANRMVPRHLEQQMASLKSLLEG